VSAGQSVTATLFCRMHAFTGDARWHDYAAEIIAPLVTVVARAPLAVAALAAAMELAVGPMREVAVAGESGDARTRALLDVVQRRFDPLTVIAWGTPGDVPLLEGRPTVDGLPAAYVCRGFVCRMPVTDTDALEADLAGRE
jgi:uncharacterized protein